MHLLYINCRWHHDTSMPENWCSKEKRNSTTGRAWHQLQSATTGIRETSTNHHWWGSVWVDRIFMQKISMVSALMLAKISDRLRSIFPPSLEMIGAENVGLITEFLSINRPLKSGSLLADFQSLSSAICFWVYRWPGILYTDPDSGSFGELSVPASSCQC